MSKLTVSLIEKKKFFFFFDTESSCSYTWPGMYFVEQIIEIILTVVTTCFNVVINENGQMVRYFHE